MSVIASRRWCGVAVAVACAAAMLAAGCSRGPGKVDRVLLITLDTTRADRMGCYGYAEGTTPQLDALAALNKSQHERFADPEVLARIEQHEMAFRMQSSVPELMDLSGESDKTFELYGEEAREAGTFSACCLNARRLAERGVRNIQIFHRGWDAHGNLPREHESQCKDVDQGCYALVQVPHCTRAATRFTWRSMWDQVLPSPRRRANVLVSAVTVCDTDYGDCDRAPPRSPCMACLIDALLTARARRLRPAGITIRDQLQHIWRRLTNVGTEEA